MYRDKDRSEFNQTYLHTDKKSLKNGISSQLPNNFRATSLEPYE